MSGAVFDKTHLSRCSSRSCKVPSDGFNMEVGTLSNLQQFTGIAKVLHHFWVFFFEFFKPLLKESFVVTRPSRQITAQIPLPSDLLGALKEDDERRASELLSGHSTAAPIVTTVTLPFSQIGFPVPPVSENHRAEFADGLCSFRSPSSSRV